jgi:LysM repeat protein
MANKPSANESQRGKLPGGVREVDLTWWLAVGGLSVFLLMLIGASVVYTVSQVAQISATETAAVALAATATAPATATVRPDTPTASATPVGGLVLADTPTRSPSPTITLSPTASLTPTITLTPTRPPPTLTPTQVGTPTPIVYVVRDGDTLGAIATVYGLTVEELLEANGDIESPDRLVIGQTLVIPVVASLASPTPGQATTQATGEATEPQAAAGLPRSILDGDLAAGYPLTAAGPRITIHYQPGSFAEAAGPQVVLDTAEQALAGVERTLDVSYSDRIDVYLAGSFFAPPNQGVRQRHFPAQRRVFILYDGSGTLAERRAMLAHEITQVVAWHSYGVPAAVMLSEGLATYAGQPYLEEGGFIAFRDFCRAMARTNRLPSLLVVENSVQGFLDPVRNLYNYRAAACFVAHLIGLEGSAAFAQVYSTGDYPPLYGSSLVTLDANFSLEMDAGAFQIGFDPDRLVSYYDEVNAGYATLFARPDPDLTAYRTLDDARIATLSGNFDGARALLDQFHVLVR